MINLVQAENISKSYGIKSLFEDVSFTISENERVALIAKNGMGKTTLLNIIVGDEAADSGQLSYKNDLKIAFLKQSPQFEPDLSVIDACLLSDNDIVKAISNYEKALLQPDNKELLTQALSDMDAKQAWDYETRIKQILGQLKITNFNQKIKQLSGGQIKRVALANALIVEPDLLILDEPTNHLDLDMVEWLEEYLIRANCSLLMVTHDRYFLDRVCTHIIEIDMQQIFTYQGNYSYYLEKRQERIDAWSAEVDSAKNIYRRELEWMRSTPQARTSKSKGRIDRFYELEERAKQTISNDNIKLNVKASYLGSKIIEINNLNKSFGDLNLIDNFSYTFARYEKVGIVGKNGTGKTTFLKLLLGEIAADSGTIDIGETVRFGYFNQSGLQFDESMKVIDVIEEIAEDVNIGQGKNLSASQFLNHFLFSPKKQHDYIHKLSGGEKSRLHLCRVLMMQPNFLILDEPTNDLDIATLNILENYLENFRGNVLVVSHDRFFMDKVVDHIFAFEGDSIIRDYPGSYTQYRAWQIERQQVERAENAVAIKSEKRDNKSQEKKNDKKMSFNDKREFEKLNEEIPALEKEIKDLEDKMAKGEMTVGELEEIPKLYEQLITELDQKSMRWLELSELS